MSTAREPRGRAIGACLLTGALLSLPAGGAQAYAQEDLEITPTTLVDQGTKAGATRGISRPSATTSPATTSPPTTSPPAASPATTLPAATSLSAASPATTSLATTSPATTLPATAEATELTVDDGSLVDSSPSAGATGTFLIPPPVNEESRSTFGQPDTTTATSTVLTPTSEPDTGPVADTGRSGWFSGATVSNGGLVPASDAPGTGDVAPTTTAPTPTTAPQIATTLPESVTAPVDPLPESGSVDPTVATTAVTTTAVQTPTRDMGRGRTSRLLEVAAVIAGVIGLSAVPVLLARLIRGKQEDELIENHVAA